MRAWQFVALFAKLLPQAEDERGRREDEEREDFSNLFNENGLSKRYLCAALIRCYTDFENTGGHNQFH
eukprot:SAG22_NODE_20590_length_264_cov_0.927273_1_plen_67_part_01